MGAALLPQMFRGLRRGQAIIRRNRRRKERRSWQQTRRAIMRRCMLHQVTVGLEVETRVAMGLSHALFGILHAAGRSWCRQRWRPWRYPRRPRGCVACRFAGHVIAGSPAARAARLQSHVVVVGDDQPRPCCRLPRVEANDGHNQSVAAWVPRPPVALSTRY